MMNKNYYFKLLFSSITLFVCTVSAIAQEESVLLSNQDQRAVIIKRVAPIYPASASSRNREGIVTVSFTVDESGEVQNIMVDDVFGSDDFIEATLRAVSRQEYEPAIMNGEPVSQNMTRSVFRYTLDGAFGAGRSFRKGYDEIMTLLASEEADKESIYDLMIDLEYSQVDNLYEIAWYAWVKSHYLNKFEPENKDELIISLRRATMRLDIDGTDNIYLSVDAFILASRALFTLHLQKNELNGAMRTYDNFVNAEQLKESDLYEGTLAYLSSQYEKITEKIESDETFVLAGNITPYGYWVQKLFRPSFSIENVNGTLIAVDLRCSERNSIFDFVENQVWVVPESWGDCDLYLEGEEGTSFHFYSIAEVAAQ